MPLHRSPIVYLYLDEVHDEYRSDCHAHADERVLHHVEHHERRVALPFRLLVSGGRVI